jgi:copper transport protein
MRRAPRLTATLLGLVAVLAWPAAASAHALLQSSDPAAGATLGSPPSEITLNFGETPDPTLSSIKVLDTGGTDHASGKLEVVAGKPMSLQIAVGSLPDGVYTVTWRTVSTVDGHVTAGSFAFGVGETPPSGGAATAGGGTSQSGSPAEDGSRFLLYLGLIGLLGAGFVGSVVLFAPGCGPEVFRRRALIRWAAGAWAVSAIGTVGVVALGFADTGADLGTLLTTQVGLTGVARLIVTVVSGLAVAGLLLSRPRQPAAAAFPLTSPGRPRRWYGITALAAIGGMAVDVAGGHGATGDLWPLESLAQLIHVSAAGIWVGGLASLLLATRGLPGDSRGSAVRRFSTWAGVALGLVVLTGLVRAIAEIGSIDALLSTDYGLVVLAKSGLLGALALLGAANRWLAVPLAERTLGRLRRIGTAEIAIATTVLALSGVLVNLVPPVSAGGTVAAGPQPIAVAGSDAGTSVKLRLVASPGTPGFNTFSVAVTDYDSGQPVDASSVSLRFTLISRSGVGGSDVDLQRTGSGTFEASGSNLSIDGIWRVTATVGAPGGAVEVPLIVATSLAEQPVQPVAGPPTVYTIGLGDQGSLQVYLDPGTAGTNDFHATFFDTSGAEAPIMSCTIAVFPKAGPPELLQPRMLEPGHFVASFDADPGTLGFDVVGAAPQGSSGGPIHAHASIEVQP